MKNDNPPVDVEDERVGKHFEQIRSGQTYFCKKAVMYNGQKFLTLVEVADFERLARFHKKAGLPAPKPENMPHITVSWCCNDNDALFFMNYMEM
jgi:hypothetical protein